VALADALDTSAAAFFQSEGETTLRKKIERLIAGASAEELQRA
jgi:hypothetical protein